VIKGVIALPPGELFSETNENSVAILLSYSRARALLTGDSERGRGSKWRMAPTRGLKLSSGFGSAVDPDHQGSIGSVLTKVALDRLKDAGMIVAMVETGGDPGHAAARRT
jgi:beta-lactamase superfamily II metal-dependent hydrolase